MQATGSDLQVNCQTRRTKPSKMVEEWWEMDNKIGYCKLTTKCSVYWTIWQVSWRQTVLFLSCLGNQSVVEEVVSDVEGLLRLTRVKWMLLVVMLKEMTTTRERWAEVVKLDCWWKETVMTSKRYGWHYTERVRVRPFLKRQGRMYLVDRTRSLPFLLWAKALLWG